MVRVYIRWAYLETKAVILIRVGLEFQPLVGEVVVEEKNFGGPCDVMKQFLRPLVLVNSGGENMRVHKFTSN